VNAKQWAGAWSRNRLLIATLCLLFLVILPLIVDGQVSGRDRYYTDLLRAHECVDEICAVDFDADGILGRVFIDRSSYTTPHEYWLVVKENGKELIRLPFWELDGNSRTRAATTQSYATGRTHLLIYEQKGSHAPTIHAVYEWTGNEMIQLSPSLLEQELFNAMAARDFNGTFRSWVLYRTFRVPTFVGYYLGLIFAMVMLAVKSARIT
jgi:hypothetical protein